MRFVLSLLILMAALPALADGYNYWGLSKPVGTCGFLNTATTNVTTSAWVTLVAATGSASSAIAITNGGTSPLQLATGAASSEVNTGIIIPPSTSVGVFYPINLGKTVRLSLEALGANQSSGYVTICFFQ